MIADQDGAFTRQVGQEVDLTEAGLGKRSKRYVQYSINMSRALTDEYYVPQIRHVGRQRYCQESVRRREPGQIVCFCR